MFVYSLTCTTPRTCAIILKWWYFFMFGNFLKNSSKYADQLQDTTGFSLSCTSCGKLWPFLDDLLTDDEISGNVSAVIYRHFIFHSQKCQSGLNFVCPASIRENSSFLCRPVRTLQMPYLKLKIQGKSLTAYIEQNKIIQYVSTPPTYEIENFVQHYYLPTPRDMWHQ